MVKQAFAVDLNKPLVWQVGHLGEAYDEWVHQPIVTKESPRFFHNGALEFLTRTPWWMIPLVWLPVAWWFVSSSLNYTDIISPYHVAAATAAGVLGWTLLEYSLHRFVFHMRTNGYWGNTVHYLFHGCHHKHPMDNLRLVFPPAAATLVLVPVWNLMKLILPDCYAPAFTGGILVGYVMYDCTHYYLHHGKPIQGLTHDLKRYHMNHHFKLQDMGFGITSTFWDRVFGTLPPTKPAKKSN
ncbi:dihydroceramide fatty acyl 2-hydroxylase FAH2-like [Andrographis paniculata]|uniref:dihydroceramide fatty acyl 2-hydroxylase FAH2-like n=1 Tax=Andrographis paniculata TaxID=175694 RepID=UPI0021E74F05|nr:dihydroceramide fatty acyl 2-hydroxylase FAH2-like [Andrographis paniculata]XP_051136160.1 dihydroceramide fatty acyl 2-hydroxylase FAH2-like [Andrographis paniculata]XP_051136161.1 dihydroceramide fatty acyl 2-hydroxylase FAH2-like [Andrographis paniculata]XP_051136162.1 dihydroceramide fatty acyl 2-hydroxylase FAH2-like [Andrographis paniculata]XP_051136163.1 dihydroceramide fatty acyl 2-hydroxylase FAH2-like [Andrographis paniculata]